MAADTYQPNTKRNKKNLNKQKNDEALDGGLDRLYVVANQIASNLPAIGTAENLLNELISKKNIQVAGNVSGGSLESQKLNILLPNETEYRNVKLHVIKHADIESKTIVKSELNDRDQSRLNEVKCQRVLSTIKDGQEKIALGILDKKTGKISVIDGSIRRFACLTAGVDYLIYVIEGELTHKQMIFLKQVTTSGLAHNELEEWLFVANAFRDAQKDFAEKNPNKTYSYMDFINEYEKEFTKLTKVRLSRYINRTTEDMLEIYPLLSEAFIKPEFVDNFVKPLNEALNIDNTGFIREFVLGLLKNEPSFKYEDKSEDEEYESVPLYSKEEVVECAIGLCNALLSNKDTLNDELLSKICIENEELLVPIYHKILEHINTATKDNSEESNGANKEQDKPTSLKPRWESTVLFENKQAKAKAVLSHKGNDQIRFQLKNAPNELIEKIKALIEDYN